MYVFEPGTGCTGTPKLVRPGDELIFTSNNVVSGNLNAELPIKIESRGLGGTESQELFR